MPEVEESMLRAGGEEIAKAWKNQINVYDFKDKKSMFKNVRYKITKRGGNLRASITSEGKDERGIRNASKAFMLHYGTSRIKASHWINDAEEEGAPNAHSAMAAILSDAIEQSKKGK